MDRARFPRDKVCGGWITPDVFGLLDLDPAHYRDAGLILQPITGFRTGVLRRKSVETRYARVVSYAVRRCEFDDFLLRRAQVCVLEQTALVSLCREHDVWIANDTIRAPVVIGAGGHFCPVARQLRSVARVDPPPAIVAKEAEFPVDDCAIAFDVPELFFCPDLEGYGWCVRKGNYLNVGIGRRLKSGFTAHVSDFMTFLDRSGRVRGASRLPWRGHAYFAAGVVGPIACDGVLLVGDAAGVAYSESGEGIRPAIESGLLCARTLIAAGGRHRDDDLAPYRETIDRLHPRVGRGLPAMRRMQTAIGRALLRSPSFTRQVVLDRWFLRSRSAAQVLFSGSVP
jgi:flavin-dependent dehydrogenase